MTAQNIPAARVRWLPVGQALWFVILALVVGLTLLNIPFQWANGKNICSGAACSPDQLSPADAAQVHRAGLSLELYSAYQVALSTLTVLACTLVASLIYWRRARDWFGIFTAIMLAGAGFTLAIGGPPPPAIVEAYPVLLFPDQLLTLLGTITLFVFFFLFPDGHFVPRWTAWLAPVIIVIRVLVTFRPDVLASDSWLGLVVAVTAVLAILYRYRRVSHALQRQQTKWVVFGSAGALAGIISIITFSSLVPQNDVPPILGLLLYNAGWNVCVLLIPLSIGLAILRSHLWDIDVLIRRTLIYGVLTALLALVYLGAVVALQAIFTAITGQQNSTLVTVVSTLAIAALFVPLRQRVQATIDRRLFRRKYDAARTLAQFGATLRDEVALDTLTEHVLGVVDDTMQPESAALWLVRR